MVVRLESTVQSALLQDCVDELYVVRFGSMVRSAPLLGRVYKTYISAALLTTVQE